MKLLKNFLLYNLKKNSDSLDKKYAYTNIKKLKADDKMDGRLDVDSFEKAINGLNKRNIADAQNALIQKIPKFNPLKSSYCFSPSPSTAKFPTLAFAPLKNCWHRPVIPFDINL